MPDLLFPRLSESMEEGTILTWLVGEGQTISTGDDLVEIETEKATVTHASEVGGVIHILVAEGTRCAVGTPIAHVELETAGSAERAGVRTTGASTATVWPPGDSNPTTTVAPAPPSLGGDLVVLNSQNGSRSVGENARIAATPLALRAARLHHVSLESVRATGPRSRVTRSDVLAAAGVPASPLAAHASRKNVDPTVSAVDGRSANSRGEKGEISTVALSRLQKIIAQRMAHVNATVPVFQVQTEVIIDEAVALQARLKDFAGLDPTPSLNDLVIKAAALALEVVPLGNSSFTEAGFELYGRINIGFAVAATDALVVPTIFDANTKTLGVLASETRQLAERVRSGTIRPAELSGGTFTVSNLGMYGMTSITPVINAPQAAILGVGATRPVLVRKEADIVEHTVMTLTLSCDHRILYGTDAARLLAAVRSMLESPLRLTL
ncbi:MAG: dihydrolipoamide acetyltransferase family protein [Acidimicrobiales bacterium]